MKEQYPQTESKITKGTISDTALLAIGRLTRAFAEIEDLINLYICNLARLDESAALIILGRSTISRKLEVAEYLAKMTNEGIYNLHKQIFSSGFTSLLSMRNNLCHGVFLGLNDEGHFAFMTQNTKPPEESSAVFLVASYHENTISSAAKAAENAIPKIVESLKLSTFREKRLEQVLLPVRQGQKQQPKNDMHSPPPQSSRG